MGIPFSTSWAQQILRALLSPDTEELVELSKELAPVIVIEGDRREWAFLKNERHFGFGNNQPAIAGEISGIGLVVPNTIDNICVVYYVRNRSAVAVDLILGSFDTGNVPGAVSSSPVFGSMDSETIRRPPPGAVSGNSATLQFVAHSVGGIGSGGPFVQHEAIPAAGKLTVAADGWMAVLRPGGFIGIQPQAVNTAVDGAFFFYERPTQARGRYLR